MKQIPLCNDHVQSVLTLFCSPLSGAWAFVQGLCGQPGWGAAHPKIVRAAPHREEVTTWAIWAGPESAFQTETLSSLNCQTSPGGGGSQQVSETFSGLIVHPGELISIWECHKGGHKWQGHVGVLIIYIPLNLISIHWVRCLRMKGDIFISVNAPELAAIWGPCTEYLTKIKD